uniref:Divinyl chlorophyllide a 8-vinyl-reductase, chloroplastic n=1 Tax=Lotharella globosa TaxID=91324 RepID=A0A6V3P3W4_9EUKA|mmetsp:Transcript_30653/g.59118  ORF Transcript_30653/g.59118 Transcript_30653/m.59118 type:complete len:415 (+) Transcript_30653:41-1285(+)
MWRPARRSPARMAAPILALSLVVLLGVTMMRGYSSSSSLGSGVVRSATMPTRPMPMTSSLVRSSSSSSSSPRSKCWAPQAHTFTAPPQDKKRVTVVGGTGYIGKFVVKELANRGYDVTAIVRGSSGIGGKSSVSDVQKDLPESVKVIQGDVTDMESLSSVMPETDVVVSCLASRTGGISDSWLIDYEATKNSMDAGKEKGAKQFVLLSAICVQKPLLEFQRAKLRFEEDLMNSGMEYSIVRPTAFFKSLAGQIENVKNGGPYVMFGDGELAACKPISERDLASYMADCITNKELINQVLPIGGPGEALTPLQQSELLFKAAGVEPNTIKVPIQIMDGAIWVFDQLAKVFKNLEDAAEFAKIGRYYAAESMLLLDQNGHPIPHKQLNHHHYHHLQHDKLTSFTTTTQRIIMIRFR